MLRLDALDRPVVWRVLLAVAVAAHLVALYWPRPVDVGSGLPVDKLVHAAIFGAVLWTGVRAGVPGRPLAAVLVVHAGVSELVQGTLLDRDGNLWDAVADLAGVGLAAAGLRLTRPAGAPAGRDPVGRGSREPGRLEPGPTAAERG